MTTSTPLPAKDVEYLIYAPPQTSPPAMPQISLVPYSCIPELVCSGMTTPVSDTKPIRVVGEWFHLEQIPDTMDKKGFTHAAKLQRKWFAGEGHVMDDQQKTGEANYGERFIDTTTITMEWLQSFARVRQKMQQLTAISYLAKDAAQEVLQAKLMANSTLNNNGELTLNANTPASYLPDGSTEITPWQGKISQDYHRSWQFQHITIDGSFLEKAALAIQGPDDLFASLGVFSLNAALSKALIRRLPFNQLEVVVTEVAIYARDTYDFNDSLNDEENDKKPDAGYNTDSQYLGHWNKNDVKLAPISAEFSNQPLVISWPPNKDNTYFCVRDVHYRKWREYHKTENHGKGHGGDLMIYSNAITVPTSFKIIISL